MGQTPRLDSSRLDVGPRTAPLLAAPVRLHRAKLEQPIVRGQRVIRPALHARLDRATDNLLTVITAPPGHGKTTTITDWLRTCPFDSAWLTTDRADMDLTRFAAHVAAALDEIVPGIATELFALLSAPDRLSPHDLGAAFGEALYDLDRDLVLVIDDFHAARSEMVAAFLEGMLLAGPRRLHTIISSRHRLPFALSRLRIAGLVEELSGGDLRFSESETGTLLALEGNSPVDPALVGEIHAAVGGWPAAVRLVAASLRAGGTTRTLRTLSDADRDDLLLDYLGEEVLAHLPALHRQLLLRASLPDRFTPALLQVLVADMEEAPVRHADLVQLREFELYREIPGLDETWFAYHPLFRDVLRRELERSTDAATIAAMQRRIAHWFADAGWTRDAVHHLVEMGDIPAAASLIETRLSEAFAREDWQAVASWLRLIPADEIRGRPDLLLASAWVAYLGGRGAYIANVRETMHEPAVRHLATDAQLAEIALIADWGDDDPDQWVAVAERAIATIHPSKRYRYGFAHMMLGLALTSAGREEEALARLAAFTERESARTDAASIRGYFGRTLVLWQLGRLTQCEQAAADQLQLAQMNGLPVTAGWGAAVLGVVAHERGHLAQATRHLEVVIAGADRLHADCVRESFVAYVLVYEAQGMRGEADRAIARMRELAITTESPHQLELVDSLVARIALIRGDLEVAQRWLGISSPTISQDDLKCLEHPLLTRIKVLVAVGAEDTLAEADRLLAEFLATARAQRMTLALLEGLAVQALLHETRGDRAAATRVLRQSLEMAAPEGIVQRYAYLGPALAPILRRLLGERVPHPHVRNVLGALEAVLTARPASARAVEAPQRDLPAHQLTDRELQVLHCLVLRLTNNEIGEELFISPITVKHHVENIAGKLGVSGRRAAVARASELGLIG